VEPLLHVVDDSFFGLSTTTAPQPPDISILGLPAWVVAVALCILGSLLTVTGLALQKQAASAPAGHPRLGHIVLSARWFAGVITGVILPIPIAVCAYGIAPMSLTTPLSGVSVVLNMILAPVLLGEKLQMRVDVPATLLILVGTAVSTAAGVHVEDEYDFIGLLQLWGKFEFLLAVGFLSAAMLGCLGHMARHRAHIEALARSRPSNPNLCHVLLPALVAAGSACFSNILLKAVGELVKSGAVALQLSICLAAAGMPAIVQLNFVNKGLALYQQTVFVPVYSSLLVVINTFYGLIFYREYVALLQQRERCGLFFGGVLLVILGVVAFSLRKPDKVDKQNVDSRSTSVLEDASQISLTDVLA